MEKQLEGIKFSVLPFQTGSPEYTAQGYIRVRTQTLDSGTLGSKGQRPGEGPLPLPVSSLWDWNHWGKLKPSYGKQNSDAGAGPPGMGHQTRSQCHGPQVAEWRAFPSPQCPGVLFAAPVGETEKGQQWHHLRACFSAKALSRYKQTPFSVRKLSTRNSYSTLLSSQEVGTALLARIRG